MNTSTLVAPQLQTTDWLSLAEQASTEMDHKKLASLTAQLCHVLDSANAEERKQLGRVVLN
jgi:hypothetical protein